jgi:hypothetical protein
MSCSNTVTVSQGNSFACTFTWTPGDAGPADLLTTTLSSTFIDRDGASYPLTVTTANDGLSFTVVYSGDTANWALGTGRWDIKFFFSSTSITRSEIFRVHVIDSVTV